MSYKNVLSWGNVEYLLPRICLHKTMSANRWHELYSATGQHYEFYINDKYFNNYARVQAWNLPRVHTQLAKHEWQASMH